MYLFGEDICEDMYSEQFSGMTGNIFYYAISHDEYCEINMFDFCSKIISLSIHGCLRIEGTNIITADDNNHITVNGDFSGLNKCITYSNLAERKLYLVDEEGYLRIY